MRKGARAQTIDSYAVFGPVHGQVPRQLHDSPFERMICGRTGRTYPCVGFGVGTDQAIHRTEKNHGGRMPLRHGVISQSPGQQKVARHVPQLLLKLLAGHGRPVRGKRLVTVVDQNVKATRARHRLVKPAINRRLVEMVEHDRQVTARFLATERVGCGTSLVVAAAAHNDTRASFSQRLSHGPPQVSARSGDQCRTPGQVKQLLHTGRVTCRHEPQTPEPFSVERRAEASASTGHWEGVSNEAGSSGTAMLTAFSRSAGSGPRATNETFSRTCSTVSIPTTMQVTPVWVNMYRTANSARLMPPSAAIAPRTCRVETTGRNENGMSSSGMSSSPCRKTLRT